MQKRNVSIAVSCALMWGTAFAESAYIAPLADQSLLLDIEKVSDDKLVTVGERGHILIKQGTGPWQQQVSPTSQMLTAVTFKGDQLGWAVGHDAVILHTQDGGNNWSIQLNQPDLEKPLMDIHFFDQQHGIAIGAYGLFYRTLDGGKSWQKELHGELLPEEDQDYLNELREEDESLYVEELSSILPHLNQLSEEVAGRIFLAGEMGFLVQEIVQQAEPSMHADGHRKSHQDQHALRALQAGRKEGAAMIGIGLNRGPHGVFRSGELARSRIDSFDTGLSGAI